MYKTSNISRRRTYARASSYPHARPQNRTRRGFIVAGRVGTGLVVAKTEEGVWSAPSAIATLGMGWGALIGGEITDFVLVLNTEAALEAFSGKQAGGGGLRARGGR